MKIFKLAQGGSEIPPGHVIVEIRITADGKIKREIIRGHNPDGTLKTKCNELAGDLLDELLNTDVEGFTGKIAGVEDEGHTDEYYEQKANEGKTKKAPPLKHKEKTQEGMPGFMPGIEESEGRLDTGMGV